ncbi:hypothetical protein SGPA1_11464 [Streptomyces misionensis JCM 4497]
MHHRRRVHRPVGLGRGAGGEGRGGRLFLRAPRMSRTGRAPAGVRARGAGRRHPGRGDQGLGGVPGCLGAAAGGPRLRRGGGVRAGRAPGPGPAGADGPAARSGGRHPRGPRPLLRGGRRRRRAAPAALPHGLGRPARPGPARSRPRYVHHRPALRPGRPGPGALAAPARAGLRDPPPGGPAAAGHAGVRGTPVAGAGLSAPAAPEKRSARPQLHLEGGHFFSGGGNAATVSLRSARPRTPPARTAPGRPRPRRARSA